MSALVVYAFACSVAAAYMVYIAWSLIRSPTEPERVRRVGEEIAKGIRQGIQNAEESSEARDDYFAMCERSAHVGDKEEQ